MAAGSGGLSLPAARLGAKVLATDWSPAMIERFGARVRDEGLSNAEGRVMDAHDLKIEDDTFDVTGSQFGVSLVPDQPLALREMVRVTKLGGRVLLIGYGSPDEFETLQFFIAALQAVVPDFDGLPDDPPPLDFQMADPDVLRHRLREAGLKTSSSTRRIRRESSSVPDNSCGTGRWDSNPIVGLIVGDLTLGSRLRCDRCSTRMIRERAGGHGRSGADRPAQHWSRTEVTADIHVPFIR